MKQIYLLRQTFISKSLYKKNLENYENDFTLLNGRFLQFLRDNSFCL